MENPAPDSPHAGCSVDPGTHPTHRVQRGSRYPALHPPHTHLIILSGLSQCLHTRHSPNAGPSLRSPAPPATCRPHTQPPAQARARAPSHLHKHAPRDDAPFQYPILMLIRIHHGMIRRIGQVPHSCPLHSRLLPTARNLNRHHQHPQLHTCMAATAAAAAAATTTG